MKNLYKKIVHNRVKVIVLLLLCVMLTMNVSHIISVAEQATDFLELVTLSGLSLGSNGGYLGSTTEIENPTVLKADTTLDRNNCLNKNVSDYYILPSDDAIETGTAIVDYAMQFLGNPYVYGGTSLTNGTDCSGFTMRVYQQFGISIDRTANAQYSMCRNGVEGYSLVKKEELIPGDLVFCAGSHGSMTSPGHVMLYAGDDTVIHASTSNTGIIKSSLSARSDIVGYGRFIK